MKFHSKPTATFHDPETGITLQASKIGDHLSVEKLNNGKWVHVSPELAQIVASKSEKAKEFLKANCYKSFFPEEGAMAKQIRERNERKAANQGWSKPKKEIGGKILKEFPVHEFDAVCVKQTLVEDSDAPSGQTFCYQVMRRDAVTTSGKEVYNFETNKFEKETVEVEPAMQWAFKSREDVERLTEEFADDVDLKRFLEKN